MNLSIGKMQIAASRSRSARSMPAAARTLMPSRVQAQHLPKPAQLHGSSAPIAAAASAAPLPGTAQPPPARPLTQQQLLDLGASFVRLWFAGIAKGPQAVQQELAQVLDADVTIMADRVRLFNDAQGFGEVLAELERAHLEYHRSEHRPMLYAASEESQRAYALVEASYQDVGAMPGHPATFRVSKVHHILVLQVRGGRAVRLWLRRQLTEEDKDELLHDPLGCYPSPFPRGSLRLTHAATHDAAGDKMTDTVASWWQAWSTAATPAGAAVDLSSNNSSSSSNPAARFTPGKATALSTAGQLLASDFKLWDAYGLYPSMRAQGRRHLTKEAAAQYLERLRYSHKLSIEIVDVAVAEGSLACFTHWQARLEPKWPAAGGAAAAVATSVGAAVGAAAVAGAAAEAASTAAVEAVAASGDSPQQQQLIQAAPGADAQSASTTTTNQQPQQQQQVQQHAMLDPADGCFLVDVLEVDVFTEELLLKDIWLFRGPITHTELQLFLEYEKQQAAAEAAQAEAAQEDDVRRLRRAAREQQLKDLLDWMNGYQQQWSDYVTHVQKALARQQQLARAQQLLQQLGDQGFVMPQPPAGRSEQQQQQQQQQQVSAAAAEPEAAAAAAEGAGEPGQRRAAGSSGNEGDIDSSRTWD